MDQTVEVWFFEFLLGRNHASRVGLVASLSKNRKIKRRPSQVAEKISRSVNQLVDNSARSPQGCFIEGKYESSAGEFGEYGNVQGDTKLEDCDSVEVKMRSVEYVKDGEVGLTPVVRRRRVLVVRRVCGEVQEGGWDPGNLYLRKLESFKMGGSETRLYCL